MRTPSVLPVLALLSLAACEAPETTADIQTPTFLADLSVEEVDALVETYELDPNFADAITAPFACAPFEDLCDVVGEAQAEELIVAMLDEMRAERPRDELLLDLQTWAADARLIWEEEHIAQEQVAFDPRAKSATKTYTSSGGYSCYLKTEVTISNYWTYVDHKATATNYCLSSFGYWTVSSVSYISASLSSSRSSGTASSSDSGSSYATDWYTTSKSIWMDPGGTHSASATGKIGATSTSTGSSVSKSVSTSTTL